MIQAVRTPAQKRHFQRCIQGYPALRTLLGQDLVLWADNPGAPVKLFVLAGGALAVEGRNAWLCGRPAPPDGWEELRSFLRFVEVERLRTAAPAPADWPKETAICCFALPARGSLPLPPSPGGVVLDRCLPVGAAADFLFGEKTPRRDDFYAATCPAAARGLARLWAARQADGKILCTVGAYAMQGGEAYMAMGQTLPERRGQGIGGWLIVSLANALAAEGWQVTFLCKPKRRRFYERLGFSCTREYYQYIIK